MSGRFDALIIGAGPAGSSAAILLAQAGWKIALVEKHEFPRRKVCGECIAASNLPLLDRLGIGAAISTLAGPPLQRVALMAGSQTVEAALPPFAGTGHPWGKALGREYLDTLLIDRARQCGVEIFQPWMARRIQRRSGMACCDLVELPSRKQHSLVAPVLIAAHGSWQMEPDNECVSLPERERKSQPSDLFGFKANFHAPSMEAGLLSVLSFPGGYGGMVLGDHHTMTMACCIRRDVLSRCRDQTGGQKAADSVRAYLEESCDAVRAVLASATQSGSWLSIGPLRPGIRITRHRDAIFRIGNAAGEAHPIIGEGMSMAFQSAALLASLLAPERSRVMNPEILDAIQLQYQAAWLRHFAPRIRLAALFAHAAMRPLAARSAMAVLRHHPALLTRAARYSGKITGVPAAFATGYDSSPKTRSRA